MRETIFITGIDGFTGRYLEQYFIEKGFDVYGSVLNAPKKRNHFQCDITKKEQIDTLFESIEPDYLIHTAAISYVAQENASLMYDVNTIGTEHLLASLIKYGMKPKKILLASSATVYGNQKEEILDESMCPMPVNHYGCSKLAMELIAKNYFSKLDIIITRPFNYTGVGQEGHFLIPKIVAHYAKRSPTIELGNLHVAREFNSVDDIVAIYFKLLMSSATSTVVNVASNRPIQLLKIIEIMNRLAGYTIEVRVNPQFVRANEIVSLSGSSEKLQSIIGDFHFAPIEKTLVRMYKEAFGEEA